MPQHLRQFGYGGEFIVATDRELLPVARDGMKLQFGEDAVGINTSKRASIALHLD